MPDFTKCNLQFVKSNLRIMHATSPFPKMDGPAGLKNLHISGPTPNVLPNRLPKSRRFFDPIDLN